MFKITQQDYDVIVFLTRGVVEPITGSIVYFKFMNKTSGTEYIRECEATDGEMGECLYTFTELEIEFENGTRLSVDNPIVLAITEERICQHNRQYGRTIKMF